jgi:hypothetical protein
MAFPVDNQSFQKGNLTGFTAQPPRRLVGVSKRSFDFDIDDGDHRRGTAAVRPDAFGKYFARLDGEGMEGVRPYAALSNNGDRQAPAGSPAPMNFSGWLHHNMTNNRVVTGGEGCSLSCDVDLAPGGGVSCIFQFASTLVDPSANEFCGLAGMRLLDAAGSEISRNIFFTSADLPAYHGRQEMQTLEWRSARIDNPIGSGQQAVRAEWFVCSGHLRQQNQPFNAAVASAFPCCLLIDFILLT